MEKYFSDNSLLRLHAKKSTITKSKSVSFSLDNTDIPSTNEPFFHQLVVCLKYPKVPRKTTIPTTLVLDENRWKTIESSYHK